MSALTARLFASTRVTCVMLMLATACSDQHPAVPLTGPELAKTPASPTVTSTSPSYGYQGTLNLNVTINGSGFDRGTKASWNLNGSPYPKITVNSTSYVSSSQLVANVSIAGDAQIQNYDVVVTTSTTKQGIGSDCFAVTLAVPIPIVGQGINMAGQVVGYFANSGTGGALWDPQVGTVSLPNAYKVWAIDETGSVITGKDNNGSPAYWTSSTGAAGPWAEVILPLPPGVTVASSRSLASNSSGATVLMAGAVQWPDGNNRPVVWTRTTSGWDVRADTLPTGVPSGWAESINAKGERAGMDGSAGAYALYWDSAGTAAILSSHAATAWSINGDGTVVVGSANGIAAMWTRTLTNGVYGPWSGDIYLDTPSNSCGSPASTALAVNAAGTVAVGKSCNVPVAWNISGSTITRFPLGTVGTPNAGTAYAVNNLATPNAAGGAGQSGSGFATGVLWKSF